VVQTGDIPFVKDFSFVYGEAAGVSPLIRRVIARNPGPFTYTGTGVYIVGKRGAEVAVIDPGPDDRDHLTALQRAVAGDRVSHVLITHTHRDHCAGARAFASAVGAPILAFGPHPGTGDAPTPLEEGADRDFTPDLRIGDGTTIEGDGWTLRALATPGHLSNHLCFELAEERALFTGDHVMGWATTVVAPPDGDMGDYFSSLERLIAREDAVYYPTHGAPIDSPQSFVRAIRAHRRMRDGQILALLARGPARIAELTETMYAGIDRRLHGAAALNVLAHLIRLVGAGEVETDGDPELRSLYRLQVPRKL
jgi:glyoxylase-like metal-dependent hydrolase (beta-lactamase superfamily II)